MPTLPYPIFISDLDGTLLTSDKKIPMKNKEWVNRYRKSAGYFTIATGRSYFEAKQYIDDLDLDLPAILCNGAVWYDPAADKTETLATIDPAQLRVFLDKLKPISDSISILVYTTSAIYTTTLSSYIRDSFRHLHIALKALPLFDKLPHEPIIKTLIVGEPERMTTLKAYADSCTLPLDFVQSSERFFEILPTGISKGSSILHLLRKLQLQSDQLAVVGDHLNDVSMLQEAGFAAAMENAHPRVIQQAERIVPTNDQHGVAYLIQHYLLSPTTEAPTLKNQ